MHDLIERSFLLVNLLRVGFFVTSHHAYDHDFNLLFLHNLVVISFYVSGPSKSFLFYNNLLSKMWLESGLHCVFELEVIVTVCYASYCY